MLEHDYSDKELKQMIRRCKEKHGVATPRYFNGMDSTCSASIPMSRFGSWDEARRAAGIEEDNTNRTVRGEQYSDADVLRDIRKCNDRNGKATVSLMNQEPDLVAPSVAIKKFKSWGNAKEEADIEEDERENNHPPRKYPDEQYYELLQRCEEKHGEVTQCVFDQDDEYPSSKAITKRFESWEKAKEKAGVGVDETNT